MHAASDAERRTGSTGRRRLDRVLQVAPNAILVVERSGRCLYVNPAAAHAVGLDPEAAEGRPVQELGLPPPLTSAIARMTQNGVAAARGEVRLETPGGERAFEYLLSPLGDDGAVVVTLRDITGLRPEEAVLLRFLERLLAASPDPLLVVDRDQRVRKANAALCRVRNLRVDQVVDRPVAELFDPDAWDELIRPRLERAFSGRTEHGAEWVTLGALGRRFLEASFEPLAGDDGVVRHVGVILRDLTESRRAEEVREGLLAQLQLERQRAAPARAPEPGPTPAAPALRSQLAQACHDLRTRLTVMLNWGQVLGRAGIPPETIRQGAAAVVSSARRMSAMVDELAALDAAGVPPGPPAGGAPPGPRDPDPSGGAAGGAAGCG